MVWIFDSFIADEIDNFGTLWVFDGNYVDAFGAVEIREVGLFIIEGAIVTIIAAVAKDEARVGGR